MKPRGLGRILDAEGLIPRGLAGPVALPADGEGVGESGLMLQRFVERVIGKRISCSCVVAERRRQRIHGQQVEINKIAARLLGPDLFDDGALFIARATASRGQGR